MKRKAPIQSSSSSVQAYVVISDSDTDTEVGREIKSKSKSRTLLNARKPVEVISISSDESEDELQPPAAGRKTTPPFKTSPVTTKTESPDSLWFLPPSSRRGTDRSNTTPEPVRFKAEKGIEMLLAAANRVAQRQRQWLFGHSRKRAVTAVKTSSQAAPQEDLALAENLSDDDYDDDYDYDADPLLGGELEIVPYQRKKPPPDVDYVELMNKSYHKSRKRLLAHQEEMLRQNAVHTRLSGKARRPRVMTPPAFSREEMDIIFGLVAESNKALRAVDWSAVARELCRVMDCYRHPKECLEAFEHAIQQHNPKSWRIEPDLLTQRSKISMVGLLGMRERGRRPAYVIKDMLLLKETRKYEHATSFNYSSGSVVDMAFKESSFKLAVANVATQDIYNRTGNLLLCDLEKGITKQLHGHDQPGEALNQRMTVTVNDIKLSYSKNFFISGADDHKTMVWDAETGERVNSLDHSGARVNRLAVMEDSLYKEDVFATCSAHGVIDIYALDEQGQVKARNKQLSVTGGKRGISSLSFGHGYFWDCLAAGMEGLDNGLSNEGLQGGIAFYDANTMSRVADGDLAFRHVTSGQVSRSVSCLAFSSSGEYLVCGTSGRTNSGDDEQGDGLLRVFDVKRAKEVESVYSGHEDVNLVDFSPCETYVISCSHRNEVVVFDRRFYAPEPLHRFQHLHKDDDESNAGITTALWWPTGLLGTSQSMLVTGGGDGTVRLWDIRRATEDAETWSFDTNVGPVARMIASRSFEHLIVGADTGAVSAFSLDGDIVTRYNNKPMTLLSEQDEYMM